MPCELVTSATAVNVPFGPSFDKALLDESFAFRHDNHACPLAQQRLQDTAKILHRGAWVGKQGIAHHHAQCVSASLGVPHSQHQLAPLRQPRRKALRIAPVS